MKLSNADIATAMTNGIGLPNVKENHSCFIKFSLPNILQGDLIYELGAWGAVLSSIDGSPDKARHGWVSSNFRDKFIYIANKTGLHLASVTSVFMLHQQYKIKDLSDLIRNGEVDLVRTL